MRMTLHKNGGWIESEIKSPNSPPADPVSDIMDNLFFSLIFILYTLICICKQVLFIYEIE